MVYLSLWKITDMEKKEKYIKAISEGRLFKTRKLGTDCSEWGQLTEVHNYNTETRQVEYSRKGESKHYFSYISKFIEGFKIEKNEYMPVDINEISKLNVRAKLSMDLSFDKGYGVYIDHLTYKQAIRLRSFINNIIVIYE